MTTTRLSTKGRLSIPKEVRERLGWQPGMILELVEYGDAVLLRRLDVVPTTSIKDLIGCAGYRGPVRSVREMEEAIEREARKQR